MRVASTETTIAVVNRARTEYFGEQKFGIEETKLSPGHYKHYHTEADRSQKLQVELYARKFSFDTLPLIGFYMLVLKVVDDTLSLCVASTARTIAVVNRARTEWLGR